MYDQTLGTDWGSLTDDEALFRMFALGVSTSLGHPNGTEYDRLRGQASTAYGRSVLELSFEEGRSRGKRDRRERDTDDIWQALVEEQDAAPRTERRDWPSRAAPSGMAEAVVRAPFLELSRDDLGRLRLPELLRRED